MKFIQNFNPYKIKEKLSIIKIDIDISYLDNNQKK